MVRRHLLVGDAGPPRQPGPPLRLGVARPATAHVADAGFPGSAAASTGAARPRSVIDARLHQVARRQPVHRGQRLVLRGHDPARPARQLHLRVEGVAEGRGADDHQLRTPGARPRRSARPRRAEPGSRGDQGGRAGERPWSGPGGRARRCRACPPAVGRGGGRWRRPLRSRPWPAPRARPSARASHSGDGTSSSRCTSTCTNPPQVSPAASASSSATSNDSRSTWRSGVARRSSAAAVTTSPNAPPSSEPSAVPASSTSSSSSGRARTEPRRVDHAGRPPRSRPSSTHDRAMAAWRCTRPAYHPGAAPRDLARGRRNGETHPRQNPTGQPGVRRGGRGGGR